METLGVNTQIKSELTNNNKKKQNLTIQQTKSETGQMKSSAGSTGGITSSSASATSSSSKKQKPRQRRIRSELDRLLSDEGTRNMLKGLKKPKAQKIGGSSNVAGLFRKRVIVGGGNSNGRGTDRKIDLNGRRSGTRDVRAFRNSSRGRGVVKRAPAVVARPPGKGPTPKPARGRSRSESPAKVKSEGTKDNNQTEEQSKIDYKLINISRRSKVAWITVIGSNGGEIKEEKENGDSGGKVSRKLDGGFGIKILQSIECAFRTLEQENSISVIVLQNSHSRYFCNGIDVSELIIPSSSSSSRSSENNSNNSTSSSNNTNANNNSSGSGVKTATSSQFPSMIRAMKSLISTLNSSRKLLVASITGDCVGFSVMLLPLFDFVYANDKSMFKVHYNALGQSPEGIGLIAGLIGGGAIGKLTSLIYLNTPLTAMEAQQAGLVTEILWPARYQEELAARIHSMCGSSSLMIKSKTIVRGMKPIVMRISDLWGEFGVIEGQWGSPDFQAKAKAFLSCDGVIENYNGNLLRNGSTNQ